MPCPLWSHVVWHGLLRWEADCLLPLPSLLGHKFPSALCSYIMEFLGKSVSSMWDKNVSGCWLGGMMGSDLLLGCRWGYPLVSTPVSPLVTSPTSAVLCTRAGYLWAQLFCDFNLNQTAQCWVFGYLWGKGGQGPAWMSAVIFTPAQRKLWVVMGRRPNINSQEEEFGSLFPYCSSRCLPSSQRHCPGLAAPAQGNPCESGKNGAERGEGV